MNDPPLRNLLDARMSLWASPVLPFTEPLPAGPSEPGVTETSSSPLPACPLDGVKQDPWSLSRSLPGVLRGPWLCSLQQNVCLARYTVTCLCWLRDPWLGILQCYHFLVPKSSLQGEIVSGARDSCLLSLGDQWWK